MGELGPTDVLVRIGASGLCHTDLEVIEGSLAYPLPIVRELGYSPVWFGVLFCLNMQVSYLSPPFGPAAFYLKGVAPKDVTLNEIFSALWPFILLQLAVLMLVLFNPQVSLWLPGLGG